jgi:hypothetical protein
MNIISSAEQIIPIACPSIQYRLRKELLGESPNPTRMYDLQGQILAQEMVRKVAASQGADGWLAWNFHGYDSMESGIRLLCESGVENTQPVLARALVALESSADHLERGFGKVGKILDDLGFGGAGTIRAWLFALAGKEDHAHVNDQTQLALDTFRLAAQAGSLEDIYVRDNGRLTFRNGILWPGIYHLRLLAWTQNWRTPGNVTMMAESVQNIVRLSPIPDIHVKYKSQIIAPASFCMHHFNPDMNQLSNQEWMQWFHRMELLSRLGVIRQIPELKHQVQALEKILVENHGLFTEKLNHSYYQKWGAYTGLALERDWRTTQRRINDLTFRSLLIVKYAGL